MKKYHEITGFWIVSITEYYQFHRLFCYEYTFISGSQIESDN